ncbi:hypothetical protein TWF694_000223 [Orbilia ellipsospora]|uniref:Uncharacterized protein n=1 Tax=Orbilia ellipsospora TaxID=2528407 RepID=A0AAV9XPJ3_9PEZI
MPNDQKVKLDLIALPEGLEFWIMQVTPILLAPKSEKYHGGFKAWNKQTKFHDDPKNEKGSPGRSPWTPLQVPYEFDNKKQEKWIGDFEFGCVGIGDGLENTFAIRLDFEIRGKLSKSASGVVRRQGKETNSQVKSAPVKQQGSIYLTPHTWGNNRPDYVIATYWFKGQQFKNAILNQVANAEYIHAALSFAEGGGRLMMMISDNPTGRQIAGGIIMGVTLSVTMAMGSWALGEVMGAYFGKIGEQMAGPALDQMVEGGKNKLERRELPRRGLFDAGYNYYDYYDY